MGYSTFLFDLDDTLLDSATSEQQAFRATLVAAGIADPEPYLAVYREINRELWAAVERNEIGPDDVRVTRFRRLVRIAGLDADPVAMADDYVAGLGAFGELHSGSRQVLDQLKGRVRLALVTNGIGQVQRARIERLGLDAYFDVVSISGELGTSKPAPGIFDAAFAGLGFPDKRDALMIGDSLSSDMRGGADYGIATCWYNPSAMPGDPAIDVTHEIRRLPELLSLAAHSG